MKTKKIVLMFSFLSVFLLLPILTGCGTDTPNTANAQTTDLMSGITPQTVETTADLQGKEAAAITDFSVDLFQESLETEENTLISPFSVLCALAMTANGAQGETLAQMEAVLGIPTSDLNHYLYTYLNQLPNNEKYQLHIANSIWFTNDERFTVSQDFLQTNANYYNASIYKAPFDDTTTQAINNWVKENTDGMIPTILDEIPQDAVMYLVNALAFDAQWDEPYEEYQIDTDTFTNASGKKQEATFMHSSESQYLADEYATGFLKYYANESYAFVALLPQEGMSVQDYAATLTGEHLQQLLANAQHTTVEAGTPKFTSEYSVEMSQLLQNMGITAAFDVGSADFSKLGSSSAGNIYINQVLHKTYLSLDENGTKAGATTAVEMEAAAEEPIEPKEIYLNRPFVYLLIDCEANLPLFMGTVLDIES